MKEKFQNINGWLLVFIALYCTVFYQLAAGGMFFDGLTYASISENLVSADSFWDLHYTATLKPDFYEHPPLAFWLQYYFFQTGWKEEVYSLLTCLIACFLIARIYFLITAEKTLNWLPVLFFVTAPVVFWSFSNNMLENTLTVFILFNLHLTLYIFKKNVNAVWFTFSGMITILCFLIKGPVGLVPLIFIPAYIYFFIPKSDWKKYYQTFYWYLAGFFISVLLLLSDQSAIDFFSRYFNEQVFDSVSGVRETANSRFYIVGKLFLEIAIMTGITLFLRFFGYKKNEFKSFSFFIFLGLCASLPIMISAKQMGFYIVPSLAFFALGLSVLIDNKAFDFLRHWIVSLIFVVVIAVSIPFWIIYVAHDSKDKSQIEVKNYFMYEDYYKNETISISPSLKSDWALHAYLYRYLFLSLDEKNHWIYYICKKNEKPPEGYSDVFRNKDYIVGVKYNDNGF